MFLYAVAGEHNALVAPLVFEENATLYPEWLNHLTLSPAMLEWPVSLHLGQHLMLSLSLILVILLHKLYNLLMASF